ncbi:MAG TPA: hypothetical protein VNE38_07770 [Ktedonobacteraceae bacterium]|nr:hypothetical protein [Ktedonobacteraceae bacterium]
MSTTTNGMNIQVSSRRRSFSVPGLALRLLLAFIISWLIVMAFFISGAVSR